MRIVLLVVIILLFFIVSITILHSHNSNKEIIQSQEIFIEQDILDFSYRNIEKYANSLFYSNINNAENLDRSENGYIKGGVMPHHDLSGYMVADMMIRLQGQDPRTFIILAPNHFELGERNVLTSRYAWQTPWGDVFPNIEIIDQIVESNIVYIDESVFDIEHSTAMLMPYIKYYFSDAKVVPIVLSARMYMNQVEDLVDGLKEYTGDPDTVVLLSMDFSHYLNSAEAEKMDEVTINLIQEYDYDTLITLNNDYLDTPTGIVTFLKLMEAVGSNKMKINHHTNSGVITGEVYGETTSYYALTFFE